MVRDLLRGLLCLLLVGCAATPYVAPSTACNNAGVSEVDPWWRRFDDPQLLALLQEARRCNVDLAQRALKVQRLRLEQGRIDPAVSSTLSGQSQKPLDGALATRRFGAELSVGYELDLWGRLARGHDAEAMAAVASEYDRQALALTLSSSLASGYWWLSGLTQRLHLARDTLRLQQQLLASIELEAQAGASAPRSVWEQQQQVLLARQSLSELERQQLEARQRLAEWLDRPSIIELEPGPLPSAPMLTADLPVDLLARRPDVAAQESALRRQLALVDRARADMLPRLTLTGSLGGGGSALGQALAAPYASALARLALPVLDWRNLNIRRQQAEIDYWSEALAYRKTVHRALREADQALREERRAREDVERAARDLVLARQSEAETELRVQVGDRSRQTLYAARIQRLAVEDRQLTLRVTQMESWVRLYRVLGGAPD